jgi:hypothetical protein
MGTPAENVRYGQARAAGRPLPGPRTGHTVRIVEYTVTVSAATTVPGSSRSGWSPACSTTGSPAAQLAALHLQRWEIELGYGESKCRLRGAEFILRSRSPELVRQEMHAHDQEQAAPTVERGFGHHPLCSFLDHGSEGSGEPLAVLLRAGNAGSNTAADHIDPAL